MQNLFEINFTGYWREDNMDEIPASFGIFCVYECNHRARRRPPLILSNLLYIGESDNVLDCIRNQEKRNEWRKYIRRGRELCFSFAFVKSDFLKRVEAALIFKHKPIANGENKFSYSFDTITINSKGNTAFLYSYFIVHKSKRQID